MICSVCGLDFASSDSVEESNGMCFDCLMENSFVCGGPDDPDYVSEPSDDSDDGDISMQCPRCGGDVNPYGVDIICESCAVEQELGL
jgi:hypothetical protein